MKASRNARRRACLAGLLFVLVQQLVEVARREVSRTISDELTRRSGERAAAAVAAHASARIVRP
jgi:hypothetical protein